MTTEKQCSKGWGARCAVAKGKRCRCKCGGENHGGAEATPFVPTERERELDALLIRARRVASDKFLAAEVFATVALMAAK